MPKRISRDARRPQDVNQAAFEMVRRATSEQVEADTPIETAAETPKLSKDDISRVMSVMGRKGGQIGGKRRLETMSKEQRRKIAAKAARARWRTK
jgi:hypothetical protein